MRTLLTAVLVAGYVGLWSGASLADGRDDRPEIYAYVADGDWCQPCNRAKRELADDSKLLVKVIFKTKPLKGVDRVPTFHWRVVENGKEVDHYHVGYSGKKHLIEKWRETAKNTNYLKSIEDNAHLKAGGKLMDDGA